LGLAEGFLSEAKQDVALQRWRSCVANSQPAAENSGKAILAIFGVPPRTHDPARELAALLNSTEIPPVVQDLVGIILPDLVALGISEHIMTDYGDETTYTLPWELFNEESAREALEKARRAFQCAEEIIARIGHPASS
jgi:HEPN domain-containing protein